ncbi:hypothetical protein E8L99_16570 [Phreatobacter aquaticus]|uniref:NrS-1 polymerase-like helicase domain-containing protein n=1 Tax=Phreatobacter aquaticus TaxID=2570229 RepID=A0A4D7QNX3_9HYPH|nr:primase-helicase family protein [Phreatobacter aquaticus]QCK87256.1 hypothetical protein E8L99_16570 [Phreatobacter aquaticus]
MTYPISDSVSTPDQSDTVTVLRSKGPELRKTIKWDPKTKSGKVTKGYENAKRFSFEIAPVTDLNSLGILIGTLSKDPRTSIVWGHPADGIDLADTKRGTATLREVPRRWTSFDMDSLPFDPDLFDPMKEPEEIVRLGRSFLPPEFHKVRCFYMLTAGFGLKAGIGKIRLFFWLDAEVTQAGMRRWVGGDKMGERHVDASVWRPSQVIYTARPAIEGGGKDPLPKRFGFLDGAEAVAVPQRVLDETDLERQFTTEGARLVQEEEDSLDAIMEMKAWLASEWREAGAGSEGTRRPFIMQRSNLLIDYNLSMDTAVGLFEELFRENGVDEEMVGEIRDIVERFARKRTLPPGWSKRVIGAGQFNAVTDEDDAGAPQTRTAGGKATEPEAEPTTLRGWFLRYNRKYARVSMEGASKVATIVEDSRGIRRFTLSSYEHFRQHRGEDVFYVDSKAASLAHGSRDVDAPESDEETRKPIQVASAWLASKVARKYETSEFLPGKPQAECGTAFNTWMGWGVKEKPGGSFDMFTDHVLNTICSGDKALDTWIWDWLASIFQTPMEKPSVAVALVSKEHGTGKTIFGKVIGRLLGNHYTSMSSSEHLLGRFNASQSNALLIQGEEAFWSKDKKAENKLKDLISADEGQIERKGVDAAPARKFARLLVTTNADAAIPAVVGERRWTICRVSPKRTQDTGFFKAMMVELENGGYEALLHHLLRRQITTDLHKPYVTEELQNQIDHNRPAWQDWVADELREQELWHRDGDEKGRIFLDSKEILSRYRDGTKLHGERYHTKWSQLFPELVRIGMVAPGYKGKGSRGPADPETGVRPWGVYLRPLDEAEEAFTKATTM